MTAKTYPQILQVAGASDVGLVRENNEDAWYASPDENIFLLADGMGGHQAGEVAAQMTVEMLAEKLKTIKGTDVDFICLELTRMIQETNHSVFTQSREEKGLKGMGTTLCCAFFHPAGLIHAHVGDSRVYRFRKGDLVQLTEDHSLVSELLELGELTGRRAEKVDYRHIITKAIGTEPFVTPTVEVADVSVDDIILMCSDGLTDLLSTGDIIRVLESDKDLEEKNRDFIDLANLRGGQDNITTILIKVQ